MHAHQRPLTCRMKTTPPLTPAGKAIRANNLLIDVDGRDLQLLKRQGPFVVIANQSLEYIDELVLMQLLETQGIPFRIIGPEKKFDEALHPWFLNVELNPLHWKKYVKSVYKKLTRAKNEGLAVCLVLHFTDKALDTALRNNLLNRLLKAVRKAELPIVPVRLRAPFPGFIRPRIGKMMILRQRNEPCRISVRIGSPIEVAEQNKTGKASEFRRFIQSKIFSLGSGLEVKPLFSKKFFKKDPRPQPLARPVSKALITGEINATLPGSLLARQGDFDILVAEARDIPHTLREIGRLRERTFRQAGEGTGKPLDLDEFDLYYHQLLLWDRKAERIVGGYRMGLGDEIFDRYGPKGFYISSLFKIKKGFHPVMRQSVELGRSYIISEYQKKRSPLFLLWKGILYFLLKNPQYRHLYGPVSISKFYSNISRGVIVAFIKNYYFNHQLAKYLKPKKPFKINVDKVDIQLLATTLGDQIKNLDNLIADIEPRHIKIPVLVRQYLKLNARFISFNVDPNFSDVLDGFIILHLDDVPQTMLEALK